MMLAKVCKVFAILAALKAYGVAMYWGIGHAVELLGGAEFTGVNMFFVYEAAVFALISLICFVVRLRIIERTKVERVARSVVRGRKVREVRVVEG